MPNILIPVYEVLGEGAIAEILIILIIAALLFVITMPIAKFLSKFVAMRKESSDSIVIDPNVVYPQHETTQEDASETAAKTNKIVQFDDAKAAYTSEGDQRQVYKDVPRRIKDKISKEMLRSTHRPKPLVMKSDPTKDGGKSTTASVL